MNIYLKNSIVEQYNGYIIPFYEGEIKLNILNIPLNLLTEQKKFEAKFATTYRMTKEVEGQLVEVVLLGLGEVSKLTNRRLQKAFATGFRSVKVAKATDVAVVFDQGNVESSDNLVREAVEGVLLADYTFDTYKSDKKESMLKDCNILVSDISVYEDVCREAKVLAKATKEARILVNEPANIVNPVTLAKRVQKYGKKFGFEVEVLGQKAIEELGMEAYMAVAKGSTIKPKFIIMRYNGNDDSDSRLGFVGKGLTYDSGGLSIKPSLGMVNMKDDMGGAAAVIGAMTAISKLQLKVNVTAVVAACENMISGACYKPGDIIGSMGGKSIFIKNTDAEGRLTLIDALHYIVTKENVSKVLDIATLTGSVLHCTGDVATVSISTDDDFHQAVQDGFEKAGEYVWRMPILDEYKELIKHNQADLTNQAGRPGTITAGLFIGEFSGELPWVHLDIAGTCWSDKDAGIFTKGGTGVGVRPLYYLAKDFDK